MLCPACDVILYERVAFKYLCKALRNKIQEFFNRVITMREVVIPIKNEKTKECFYVPNREFSEMVRLEGGLQFLNVTVTQNIGSVENNSYYTVKEYNFKKSYRNKRDKEKAILEENRKDYISAKKATDKSLPLPLHKNEDNGDTSNGKMLWYHGTKSDKVIAGKDLDPKKCSDTGEFGQGVYFTNMLDLANDYALTIEGKQLPSSKVFEFEWFSNELDMLFHDIPNHKESFIHILHGTPDEQGNRAEIRVKVFPVVDKEWVETILRGWAGYKVEDVEMVIGPLASTRTNLLAQKESDNIKAKEGVVEDFVVTSLFQKAESFKYGLIEPTQLCCYELWVKNLFVEVGCRKPNDIT